MKKKLIYLSIATICASQLLTHKDASAIVTGKENPYKSEALKVSGRISSESEAKKYKERLEDLLWDLQAKKNIGYDEPEYKDLYKEYTDKVLAEIEAVNKFNSEQEEIDGKKKTLKNSNSSFGLTYDRFVKVYNSLFYNKQNFERKLKEIGDKNRDLKEFNDYEQYDANTQVNTLENKIKLIVAAFNKKHAAESEILLNKLYLIVGFSDRDTLLKEPKNQRMLNSMIEDLDCAIDEFFKDIGKNRPKNIEPLTRNAETNRKNINKLLYDINMYKFDETKKTHQNKEESIHNIKEESSKKKYDEEYKKLREKAIEKISLKNNDESVAKLDDDEESKQESKQKSKQESKQKSKQESKQKSKQESKQKSKQESKQFSDLKNTNATVKYGARPQFNSNLISNKNNISLYSNGGSVAKLIL
ncbi:TPA: hypothetical protein RUV49_002757 [Staphylococcus aureus]|nr:hypothetical protein [Staphylococcus aureus]